MRPRLFSAARAWRSPRKERLIASKHSKKMPLRAMRRVEWETRLFHRSHAKGPLKAAAQAGRPRSFTPTSAGN